MTQFKNSDVAKVFGAYPEPIKAKLLFVRQLIFDTAAETTGVGPLEECLKWGEPAYLTSTSHSGTTIRIDQKKSGPAHFAVYFNCRTTLVDTFRSLFPDIFTFEGQRSIVFDIGDEIPVNELRACITMALTYHLSPAHKRHPRSSDK